MTLDDMRVFQEVEFHRIRVLWEQCGPDLNSARWVTPEIQIRIQMHAVITRQIDSLELQNATAARKRLVGCVADFLGDVLHGDDQAGAEHREALVTLWRALLKEGGD